MAASMLKLEVETEECCVCGGGGDLVTPEEFDANAPPMQAPLRTMLLHLNNNKVVPEGRLCSSCVQRAAEAYEFSTALSNRSAPPLSEKIRALRRRLHELTQKIDVFIVVGGPGAGAGNAYSEDDIIMVEKDALAAATAADDEDLEHAKNAKGDTVYQCSVCPLSFMRVAEYRQHQATHPADAAHSCWTCGAQFASRAALRLHARDHRPDPAVCHLCDTTFQEQPDGAHPQVPRGPPRARRRLPPARRYLRHLRPHVRDGGRHEAPRARAPRRRPARRPARRGAARRRALPAGGGRGGLAARGELGDGDRVRGGGARGRGGVRGRGAGGGGGGGGVPGGGRARGRAGGGRQDLADAAMTVIPPKSNNCTVPDKLLGHSVRWWGKVCAWYTYVH